MDNKLTLAETIDMVKEFHEAFKIGNEETPIAEISNTSTNETLSRTLITSVTTLLALFSIYFFGGAILKGFSFAMILGVIVGTYSSIFVATPILNYTKVNSKSVLKEDN